MEEIKSENIIENNENKVIENNEMESNKTENTENNEIENDEIKDTENNEIENADNNQIKNKKRKKERKKCKPKKTPLNKYTTMMLIFSVLAIFYSFSFIFSGIITLIPALFLWIFWLLFIAITSIFSLGMVWTKEGYKNFNQSFMNFNTKVGNASLTIAEFLYKAFPYFTSFFGLCVLMFLTLSIIGLKKQKDKREGYKGKLILSIIFTVLYIALIIFDCYFLTNLS